MCASNPPGAAQCNSRIGYPARRTRSVDGVRRARREPRADTAATAVVGFAVTNVDCIIVPSVLFARRDLRFHSLSTSTHKQRCRRAAASLVPPGEAVG
jgi:hypothetical protein